MMTVRKKQSTDSNYTSFRMQTKYMLKSMLILKMMETSTKTSEKEVYYLIS